MIKHNGKPKISGQRLIYVLVIIVFAIAIIYGYAPVKHFTAQGTPIKGSGLGVGSIAGAVSVSYPLIENQINSGTNDKNVFFAPPGDRSFLVNNIEVVNDVECVSVSDGKITLRLENKGDVVSLSGWS